MTPASHEMGSKQRILMVGPSVRFLGGQAVQAMRLVEALKADAVVDVEYLVVDPVLPAPLNRLQRVPLLRTLVTSAAYVLSLLRTVWRFDTVHAFSASYWSFLLAPTPAIVIGRLFGRRVVLNYHSGEADDHLTRWGWHAKPILRLATLIVVPTDYLVEVFAKHGLSAVAVPNHVAMPHPAPEPRAAAIPRFFSNRNFEVHYNVAAVIEAFATVQRAHPTAELVIAGNGSLRSALEAKVQELGLRGCRFTGPVPPHDMAALYADADVFVNASLIDNMPLSLLEAYASNLPVVTSDAGGIPWIAENGITASVVPAGNTVALAKAMQDAVEQRDGALGRARAARAYVAERFSWPSVREGWLRAYAVPSGRAERADAVMAAEPVASVSRGRLFG